MTFLRIVIPLSVPTFPDHALPAPRNGGLKRRIQISNSEWICVRVLAARCARGLHQLHPPSEQRAQGKPGADCTRGRAHKKRTSGPQVQPDLRLSLREWFTAYFVLSPVTGFLATVALRMTDAARPRLGGHISAKLDASVGASGPHDFAVRDRLRQRSRRTSYHPPSFVEDGLQRRSSAPRSIAHGKTRPAIPSAPDTVASIASHRAFVTTRDPPLIRVRRAESHH